MNKSATSIRLSASDLSNHLACLHLTALDLEVADGERPAPDWNSPDAQILRERGIAHENAYVEHLRSSGLAVVSFRDFGNDEQAVDETILAMQAGVDIIVQAAFGRNWFGRADVLRKVKRQADSATGPTRHMIASSLARPKQPRFSSVALLSPPGGRTGDASRIHVCGPARRNLRSRAIPGARLRGLLPICKSRFQTVVYAEDGQVKRIPNQHRTARSAGGSRNATRSGETMIICPSSRASAGCSGSNLESGTQRRLQR